ncbi:MAG: hypothetical protein B6D41_01150 [Chloroflexi bacterium UTCFX4]|nr:MAG: hypothetical protein B6D41_01150 [Chloroflexi bacterium UTCFX4]
MISPKVGEQLAASSLQHALFGAAEHVTPGTIEVQDLLSNPSIADRDIEFENGVFKLAAKSPGVQADNGGGGGGGVAQWADAIDPFPSMPTLAFHVNEPGMLDAFTPVTVSSASHLCCAIVDLTGSPIVPPYAGLNDREMVFSGSMLKICAMYAAFALRAQVQAVVDAAPTGSSIVPPGIINEIERAWTPKLRAMFPNRPTTSFRNNQDITFPKLDQIFTFSPDGKVDFASAPLTIQRIDEIGEFGVPEGRFNDWMRLMMRWSNNLAASQCILALGYFYLNGVLAETGFFDSATSSGLWLSADYNNHDWVRTETERQANAAGPLLTPRWATAQGRRRSNITATAEQTARLITLLAQGKLVKSDANHPDPNDEMRRLMQAAIDCVPHPPPLNTQCGIGSYVADALDGVSRDFTKLAAKKGFGDDAFSHECAIVERTVGGKDLRYVVVGLGSAPDQDRRDLSDLFVLLDEAMVTRNS